MPRWSYVQQATQPMLEYLDALDRGDQIMAERKFQDANRALDALQQVAGIQQTRQTMQYQREMHPLLMRQQAAVTGQAELGLGREQRLEQAYQTIARERGEPIEVVRARAEAMETQARLPAAQEQIQRYAARRELEAVPTEVRAEVTRAAAGAMEANLAAKSAQQLMAQDYPRISAAAKTAMAELEPVQVARQIDATTQRILTEMQSRDPTIAQIKANIAYTQARTKQLGEAQAQDWRALLNMYQYLAKLKADDYALKTYGRTTAELEVDRLQQRGQMTKEDAIRLYVQLLRMTDPLADPMTALMWQQFGIDRSSQQEQMNRRNELMERLRQYIETGGTFTMQPTSREQQQRIAEERQRDLEGAYIPSPTAPPPGEPGAPDIETMLDAFFGGEE